MYVKTYVCAYIQAVGLLRWGKQRTFQKGSTLSSILNKRTRGERVQNNKITPEPGPSVPFWEEKETSNRGQTKAEEAARRRDLSKLLAVSFNRGRKRKQKSNCRHRHHHHQRQQQHHLSQSSVIAANPERHQSSVSFSTRRSSKQNEEGYGRTDGRTIQGGAELL